MKTLKFSILTLILTCSSQVALAAPPPPPSGSPACWPPPCIPVDNGLIFLIAAGALFGAKKLVDSRKKSRTAY